MGAPAVAAPPKTRAARKPSRCGRCNTVGHNKATCIVTDAQLVAANLMSEAFLPMVRSAEDAEPSVEDVMQVGEDDSGRQGGAAEVEE